MKAADSAIVVVLIAWVVAAWLFSQRPGGGTPTSVHHRPAVSDPFGAFNPLGPHSHVDCEAYMQPLLRSLRKLDAAAAHGLDRRSYVALLSTTDAIFSRTNFGALDLPCAVDVATPADAAWNQYVEVGDAWLRCAGLRCTETRLSGPLRAGWARARAELTEANRALRALERPKVSLHRAR